jgi:hypothetical protein
VCLMGEDRRLSSSQSRRALCAATAGALALALGGCSGGQEGAAGDAALSSGGAPVTVERLKPALLAPADLPAGFQAQEASGDDGNVAESVTGDPTCKTMVRTGEQLEQGDDPRKAAHAFVDLVKGETGPFVGHGLVSYRPGDAEKVLREFSDAVTACKRFTMDLGGSPATFSQQQAAQLGVGEASHTSRFKATVEGSPFHVDQALVRVRDVLLFVEVGATGAPAPGLLETATKKAVAKLEQQVGS